MKKRKIEIYDTLFRDGMQGQGMRISPGVALTLLRKMDKLGFDYAEIGFVGANKFTQELTDLAKKEVFNNLKLTLFGRTRKPKEKVEDSSDVRMLAESPFSVATLVAKSRLLDVEKSLKTTGDENLKMITDSIDFLKKSGKEVILDLEHSVDAWFGRGNFGEKLTEKEQIQNKNYFLRTLEVGIVSGADCIAICDTNGGGSPEEINEIFTYLLKKYPNEKFSAHFHNDNGLALANSRSAVLAGAGQVQGVVGGYGERCGNADLFEFISRIQIKDEIDILPKTSLIEFKRFSEQVALSFGKEVASNRPFVGDGAFGTFAGMHASSEVKDEGAYLQCRPELVGNEKKVGVNLQSGRANVAFLARKMGFAFSQEELSNFFEKYQEEIEYGAFEVSEDAFFLACEELISDEEKFFAVKNYWAKMENLNGKISGSAELEVEMAGLIKKVRQTGEGVFDALSKALLIALKEKYPILDQVKLASYDLHALEVSAKGSSAPVRVLARFSKNGQSWTAVGISTSSIEAGFKALENGLKWFLFDNFKK